MREVNERRKKEIRGKQVLFKKASPTRINLIDRVVGSIDVRVPAQPTALLAFDWVSRPETPGRLIEIVPLEILEISERRRIILPS